MINKRTGLIHCRALQACICESKSECNDEIRAKLLELS